MRLENKNTNVTGALEESDFNQGFLERCKCNDGWQKYKKLIDAFEELGKPEKLSYFVAEATDEQAVKSSVDKTFERLS